MVTGLCGYWAHSLQLSSGQLPLACEACLIGVCEQESWQRNASKAIAPPDRRHSIMPVPYLCFQ